MDDTGVLRRFGGYSGRGKEFMTYPDIYFEPFWGKLNAALEKNGRYGEFVYEDENGSALYHYILRPVEIPLDGEQYYDTITPYGFNGPVILECREGAREQLAAAFEKALDAHCREQHIVAEYVRFCPWLYNDRDFGRFYTLRDNGKTFGIDLTGDFFHEELNSNRRNKIRKAIRSGVTAEFDFEGKSVPEFLRLYGLMAERNQIDQSYRFSEAFIRQTLAACGENAFFINGRYEGKLIDSGLFLTSEQYIHAHLLGNDAAYFGLNADQILIYEACRWGKEHGKKTLHLGGAHTESLIRYKYEFTRKCVYDFRIGTKIRNPEVYERLVRAKGEANPDFFPAYR